MADERRKKGAQEEGGAEERCHEKMMGGVGRVGQAGRVGRAGVWYNTQKKLRVKS